MRGGKRGEFSLVPLFCRPAIMGEEGKGGDSPQYFCFAKLQSCRKGGGGLLITSVLPSCSHGRGGKGGGGGDSLQHLCPSKLQSERAGWGWERGGDSPQCFCFAKLQS